MPATRAPSSIPTPDTTSRWSRMLKHTDGHNKWYFVSVEPVPGEAGYTVMTAYGPIGSCHKIDVPMYQVSTVEEAQELAEARVREKERKGYRVTGESPTFELIARSDPKRLMRLMARLVANHLATPQAVRFLRTLFSSLSDDEVASISPADLLPLLRAGTREARLVGMSVAAELTGRRRARPAAPAAD